MKARLAAIATTLLLAGCLLGPDYERPEIETPAEFRQRISTGAAISNTPWWKLFEDPELERLIYIALEESKDLAIATARLEETRARLGFVRADQFPRLDAGVGAERGNLIEQIVPGAGIQDNFVLTAELSFQVDLFGQYRRSTEAARAELLASEDARATVLISLIADVASTYFLLRDLDQRYEISERTLKTRSKSTRLVRARFSEGTVPRLDLNQAQIQEAQAAVELAAFERQVIQTENLLNVLLGRNPGPIARGVSLDDQYMLPEVPVGLPSELLDRRPDVRAAEQLLAAQTARIGVAEALRYPSLSLTATGGYASAQLSSLTDCSAAIWNIGANFFAPLFNAGQNKRRVEIEIARTEQLLNQYELTILQALREVEDALVSVRTLGDESAARKRQVRAARSAAFLSRARYFGGVTSYLEVLETERSQFDAELAASAVRRAQLVAIADLYKALGGGWDVWPEDEPSTDAEQ
jgi:multidrug efflux system outer membrane protein